MYSDCSCTSSRKRRGRKNIWRKNGWKFPKFDETTRKLNELQVRWTQKPISRHTQIFKSQTILKAAREKSSYTRVPQNKMNTFLIRNFGSQEVVGWYIQNATRKTQLRILYLAKYPSKVREKLRYSWLNERWGSSLPLDLPPEKC